METLLIAITQKIFSVLRAIYWGLLAWGFLLWDYQKLILLWYRVRFFKLHLSATLMRKHVIAIIVLILILLKDRRSWDIPNWTIEILFVLIINALLTYGTEGSELNLVDFICDQILTRVHDQIGSFAVLW
jgi:hypothetical protein